MRCPPIILAASIALVTCLGCAGKQTSSPVTPSQLQTQTSPSDSHFLWGFWEFRANPAAGTLDVSPMRTSAMHVNVLPFLEPPAGLRLKVSNLHFDGALCDVDVSLVHPFPGFDQYTGFDVCGIFISSGEVSGFADPDIIMTGPGDTRLLNPDRYTRWWNPVEFSIPGQPIMRYKDGLLGTKYTTAGYNCTLNGYKLFADGLNSDADIHDLGPDNRNTFSAGQSRTRHYTIDFSYGVTFNYAVDANWEPPTAGPPYTVDDFPELANRPEAWAISVTEIENTLWNDGGGSGGNLSLLIDVWDHQDGAMNTVWVDSPGNFTKASSSTPVGGGPGYSTFQVNIVGATPKPDWIDMLIGVESDAIGYSDVLPDDHVTAYFTHTSLVSGGAPIIVVTSPNGGEEWYGNTDHDITWTAPPSITYVDISYSKDNFVSDIHTIVNNTANDGLYQWKVADDPSTTVRVRISSTDYPAVKDISDGDFAILATGSGWGRSWAAPATGEGKDVAIDDSGNAYVTGVFSSAGDFDPGPGVDTHIANGYSDAFLIKIASNGDYQWALTWGGTDQDMGDAVALDSSGNVYVAGEFRATVDFDPGAGVVSRAANDERDVFVSKFDPSGAFQWVITWGGTNWDYPRGIALDSLGNIYVTGAFYGPADFDPGPGIDNHNSSGWEDVFLSKFDSTGAFQWARTWGGINGDYGYDLCVAGLSSVYVTGAFSNTADFDPGPGVANRDSNGGKEVFLSKFNSAGAYQWALAWGGPDDDYGEEVVAKDGGDVYVTGSFVGSVDFNPGSGADIHDTVGGSDIFLSRFDPTGAFIRALTWGSDHADGGQGIASDAVGNIYVTGRCYGAVDFDPGPGVAVQTGVGGWDVFLNKFDSNDNYVWARLWSGWHNEEGYAVAVRDGGYAYFTGYFHETVDFDPGAGVDNHTATTGAQDPYLIKVLPNGYW